MIKAVHASMGKQGKHANASWIIGQLPYVAHKIFESRKRVSQVVLCVDAVSSGVMALIIRQGGARQCHGKFLGIQGPR